MTTTDERFETLRLIDRAMNALHRATENAILTGEDKTVREGLKEAHAAVFNLAYDDLGFERYEKQKALRAAEKRLMKLQEEMATLD